jgi:hypothetical protein
MVPVHKGFMVRCDDLSRLGLASRIGARFVTDQLERFAARFEIVDIKGAYARVVCLGWADGSRGAREYPDRVIR